MPYQTLMASVLHNWRNVRAEERTGVALDDQHTPDLSVSFFARVDPPRAVYRIPLK